MRQKRRWLKQDSHISHSPAGGAGTMTGSGAHKMVMHSSESGTGGHSLDGVVEWVKRQGSSYHLIIDDTTKKAVQIYPFDRSARAMLHGYDPGGCNRDGSVVVQVCILGHAADHPAHHLSKWATELLADICDSWGIPRHVTMDTSRSMKSWQHSGITTHSSAPGNDHHDLPLPPHFLHPHKPKPKQPRDKNVIVKVRNGNLHQVYRRQGGGFTIDHNQAHGHLFTRREVRQIRKKAKAKGWTIRRVTKSRYPWIVKAPHAHWPHADVSTDFNTVARNMKHLLAMTSGLRTYAEQGVFWDRYQHGGNIAARPGTSNHESGEAADVHWLNNHDGGTTDAEELHGAKAEFNRHHLWRFPKEAWHMSRTGN